MNWNNYQNDQGTSRKTVAAVAVIILLVIGFAFWAITSNGNQQATTTTTTTIRTGDDISNTTSTTDPFPGVPNPDNTTTSLANDQRGAQGDVQDASELAYAYPRSSSNIKDDAAYKAATDMTLKFVTTDTTGANEADFADYYSNGYAAAPWVKDFNPLWVYATEPIEGVIKGTVWFDGVDPAGAKLPQAIQWVYLDKDTLRPIQPNTLRQRGVVDNDCCLQVIPN